MARHRKRSVLPASLLALALLALVTAGVFVSSEWSYWAGNELNRLWKQGRYLELAQRSEARLAQDPYDLVANVFGGLGYFYSSLGSEVYLQALPELSRATQLVRRALALGPKPPIIGQLYYILGKSYARMGGQYSSMVPHYLELSLQQNYLNSDSYETLALGYLRLQDSARSLAYFQQIEQQGENSDTFLLALAGNLRLEGQPERAREKLLRLLKVTQNDRSRQEALLQLAEIDYNEGRLSSAKNWLEQSLSYGAGAGAFYLAGEVYRQQGDEVRARAYWRDALKADPSHKLAKERLAGG